ncbi:MAG: acyl carrier protein [Rubrivivax sp.]
MDRHSIRAGVLAALAEIAPEVDPATLDAAGALRRQVDLDSMDWLNVIVAWHRRFGVEIPEADYRRLASIDDVVGYLAERLA